MDVELVRWPVEADRRAALSAEGVPCLLLVDENERPPIPANQLEDWIRLPADEADLHARVEGLRRRSNPSDDQRPELDADGLLRFAGRWVSLPPVESRLVEALLDRFGAVVSRDALAAVAWPDGSPGRNALDVHVLRLRRRIDELGLAIRTVRSRGYLLEAG
jgi:DNA-binding response OmpR family regulator